MDDAVIQAQALSRRRVRQARRILLPAYDKAFSSSEMPAQELLSAKNDDSQVVHSGYRPSPICAH